jgi:hypothetical protein
MKEQIIACGLNGDTAVWLRLFLFLHSSIPRDQVWEKKRFEEKGCLDVKYQSLCFSDEESLEEQHSIEESSFHSSSY